ncbi:TPA: hypothetical protein PJF92_000116 [Escherichia coli]|nr:hypothetical protein [Escherichia coli]HDH7160055.1 hypothetical protein [Escherichia coli]
MTITYEDIKNKRKQLDDKRSAHVARVVDGIRGLRDSYISSLELPSKTWMDINGKERQYVLLRNSDGYELQPHTIPLNEDYKASFIISTVVDDTPRGGGEVYVPVVVFIIDDKLKVEVNEPASWEFHSCFVAEGEQGAFDEVCEKIKDAVLMSIADHGLELKSFNGFGSE